MIRLLQPSLIRERSQTIVPLVVAATVAVLGAVGYLELVALLLEYVG